jgi:hypothetical protein
MWENVVEFDCKALSEKGSGCLLAHEMGLGKTLTTITFINTFLREDVAMGKTALIIAPVSVLQVCNGSSFANIFSLELGERVQKMASFEPYH